MQKRTYRKLQHGFTLVELLIYMGILAFLLVLLTQIFTQLLDVRIESEASSVVEQDSRFILARLIYDIHRSESITTPAALGDSNPTLQMTINGSTYLYALQGDDLILSTASANIVNSYDSRISNVSFKRIGNTSGKHTVQVTYTVTSKTQNPGGSESKTITTTVGTR